MSEECIFCKIAAGEVPCHKVYEDKDVMAFLDAFPETDGHTLVIPKKHTQDLFETDDEVLKKMITISKDVGQLMKKNLDADGVNLVNNAGEAAGQVVPHIHFHLIPRFKNDGRKIFFGGRDKACDTFEVTLKKLLGEKNESK